MKRKVLNTRFLKQTALAVPAAALMLGAAQAGTTVGLNFQAWYYDSGTTPQTVGYGAGYQTTGFPVTAKAFGVEVADWTNSDPLDCNAAFTASVPFGGTLNATVNAANMWQSGFTAPGVWGTPLGDWYAAWPAGTYVQSVMQPGDYEVTWGMIDNTGWSIDLTGLAAKFPSGYVVELIGADKTTATSSVGITNTADSTALGSVTFTVLPDAMGLGASAVLTNDAITLGNPSRPDNRNCALAGLIITDKPVVSQKPVGGSYNSGSSISLSASAVGIPPLSYQWQHAGTNLPGATTTSYVKAGAAPEDAGNYELVATNLYGAGTSVVATVTVVMVPTITTDISSATNYQSLSHRFSLVAGGQLPLSYQWIHAGTNLPGATAASLLLNNLQATDAGSYKVIVTNTLGAATSSVATLTLVASLPYEGFNYADGDITNYNGGTGWAGPWTQPWTSGGNAVASPGDTYQDAADNLVVAGSHLQLGANGAADFGSDRALAATVGGGGTVYISFLGAFPTGGWEGIELLQDTAVRAFLGQGWYGEPWGCGSFPYPEILTSKPSTILSYLVYRFDYTETNTQVRIYVNPTLASEPVTADATGTMGLFQFNTVRIMAHAVNAGTLDEFRIGGTWASVNPNTPRTDPPVIVQDLPTAAYAYVGGNAALSIAAAGAPTLHYQWKKGTSPVGTDSPTLALTGLTTGNSVSYSVTINNSYGSTNSVTCLLTVVASPDLYTSQVLPDAPGAYWPLSETVPATAYDYSGGGKDGTQNGGLTLGVAGPRPPAYAGFSAGTLAYQFDGTAWIDCGTAPSLSGTTDFTLEAWINTTDTATSRILQQRYSGGYNGEYMLDVNGNGTVSFTIYGGGGFQYSFSSAAAARRVNDGKWHHVAAVRSGTNGFIYVDGSLAASASGTTVAPLDPTFTTVIGRDQRGANSYFVGMMADVAIYGYALSAVRIQDHASKGVLANASPALTIAQGGWIEDSKPVGQPHDGMNLGVSWVASSTDAAATPVTRTGVAQFSSGAQIAVPANADFNSPTGTICFWMRAPVPAGGHGTTLFDRRAGVGLVMTLDGTPSGGIGFQCDFTTSSPAGGYGYVLDNNWHHVALVYDQSASGSVTLYVDAAVAGSQANTAAWSWPAAQQIELGRSHDTYWQEYVGQMDDFRIYSRVLNDTEIAAVMASDDLVDSNALKVRYNFGTAAGVGRKLTWPIGLLQSSPAVAPAVWTPINTTTTAYPLLPPYAVTPDALFYSLGH
jgi:hypothetical protein